MTNCTIKDGKYFAPNGAESLLYKNLRKNVSEDEAYHLFISSKTPSFVERMVKPLINNHISKVLQIPENIKFKETFENKIRTFHIYSGKTKVGRIQMTPYKDGFKVKSALVNEKQRGKGYGKYLYNYAISRLLAENNSLYTDTARTEDADRIWEGLKKQGLSQDGKSVKALPKEFDVNGEIEMDVLLQYTADTSSQTLPLNAVEKSHLINLQIAGVETSDDLYNVLYDAFYKNNLFSPNLNKLKKIYSEDEIRNILQDSEIQGRVRETIEKLRQTEEFTIPQVKYNKEFDVRSTKVNIIGQYKKHNPLRVEQKLLEQDYTKVPVINEAGEQLETQLFYENAIKEPSEKSIRALQAIVGAHPMVDTTTLENNLIKAFKNYGMDIEGLERENFKELLAYITEPSDDTRKALEDALGFVREPLTKAINIPQENKTLQYLKTAKSEQELFDEMSLIQTPTPNVYHKINKIDEQEMRDIQENQDLTIPEYQLYKDYYGYGLSFEIETIKNKAVSGGTFMKAPNGNPTNLSEDNWLFVRTQAFKNWSNNWKETLLDENNEPKVFFHSSKEEGITEFLMRPSNDDLAMGGFFVTPKKGWDFAGTGIEYQLFIGYSNKDIFDIENEDNVAEFAYRIFDNYRKDLGKIEYSDIFDAITPKSDRTYFTIFKEKYAKEIKERSKKYKEKSLFDELGDFYRAQSKEELFLEDLEKYPDKNDELSLVLNTLSDINRRHSLYRDYTSIERNGDILKKLGFKGAYVFESKIKNIHLYNTDRIKSAENTRAQIERESNDIRYFKKPSNVKPIQTNVQTDINYLTNGFIADFAAEKLKNPTEFNRQFKITETGIELITDDIITLEIVKAYIKDGTKYSKEIADYSLISKDMPNLKEKDGFTVETVDDKRVQAVNDINSVTKPTTELTILDEESFFAPNETQRFLRVGENVYEQQEQGYYNKIEKNTNPNFFDLNPQQPEFKNFDLKQGESAETKAEKLIDKETDNENFGCFS